MATKGKKSGVAESMAIPAATWKMRLQWQSRLQFLVLIWLALLGDGHVDVRAAPARPDFWTCSAAALDVKCCDIEELMQQGRYGPPVYKEWADYLRDNPLPKSPRLRRAAHLMSAASNRTYLQQLHLAYQKMQALPADDPRSVLRQNVFHCMYGGLRQSGFPDTAYTIHTNWLFFPFHRWFTFFHERMLAKLVGDETFALPFWNWDNQTPMEPHLPNAIPFYFRDPERYPALHHQPRDPRLGPGQRPAVVVLGNVVRWNADDLDAVRRGNNYYLHEYIVTRGGSNVSSFLSLPFRAGGPATAIDGWDNFENRVHGSVHTWVSDQSLGDRDFGTGSTAVLDPLFFLHHANVDRLWSVWQDELKRPSYQDDPDWMEADFFFCDENGDWVRVKVADCVRLTQLGIVYEEVDNPWITYDGPPPSYDEFHLLSSKPRDPPAERALW